SLRPVPHRPPTRSPRLRSRRGGSAWAHVASRRIEEFALRPGIRDRAAPRRLGSVLLLVGLVTLAGGACSQANSGDDDASADAAIEIVKAFGRQDWGASWEMAHPAQQE